MRHRRRRSGRRRGGDGLRGRRDGDLERGRHLDAVVEIVVSGDDQIVVAVVVVVLLLLKFTVELSVI